MGNSHGKIRKESSNKVKLLLMGKAGVGKSSIVSSFQDSIFNENYDPTVGCQLINLSVQLGENSYQLLVMDSLADSDLSLTCRLKSIQNTEVIAIVFDLTNPES